MPKRLTGKRARAEHEHYLGSARPVFAFLNLHSNI